MDFFNFFKKSKRIKELEARNEELLNEIMSLKARERSLLFERKEVNVEKYQAVESFPTWFGIVFAEEEVKHRLVRELFPLIKIERDYDPDNDAVLLRASIRVVKE